MSANHCAVAIKSTRNELSCDKLVYEDITEVDTWPYSPVESLRQGLQADCMLPDELQSFMKEMYAGLEGSGVRSIEENIETAKKLGFQVLNSFTLPKKDWWDYYSLIEVKLPSLKAKYKDDQEALQYFAIEEMEIEMYRKYSDYYGYVFYVLQKV